MYLFGRIEDKVRNFIPSIKQALWYVLFFDGFFVRLLEKKYLILNILNGNNNNNNSDKIDCSQIIRYNVIYL